MFRPVFKKKNEISKDKTIEVLLNARRGVLAVNGENGYPYAIPINYLYDQENNKIYFHGSRVGYKVDALKLSDKVCFTVYSNEIIKDESWAPYLKSAVVFGRCHLINDVDESLSILKKFALKYYPSEKLVDEEIKVSGKAAQIFVIDIEHISGKEVQER